ncbi:MAG: glycoside hydrolase [Halobacteriales archaeon]|nr:glycoside hydrolase [Halobacteriales archaeon]
MRLLAALGLVPLLVLALAGCVSTSQPLATSSLSVPLPVLGVDKALHEQGFAGEPNIAVLPDGTLFIAAVAGDAGGPNAQQGGAWLWRSKDQGAAWDTLRQPGPLRGATPLGGGFCSCDADVITSPDGWVYYTDWWIAGFFGPGNFLVERSGDGGQTWESSPITTVDALNGVDRQWLVAGENGFVGLFYAYYYPVGNTVVPLLNDPLMGRSDYLMTINAVLSTDHGASWSQPVTVTPPLRMHEMLHGKPFLLSDGTLMMPYGDVAGNYLRDPGIVTVAISKDQGKTWSQRRVAEVPQSFEAVWPVEGAADAAGNAYVIWNGRDGPTMNVWVSRSSDDGATWGAPIAIRSAGLNFLPWVTARGDGTLAAGWYGSNTTGDPAKADNDTHWLAYTARSADHGATWQLGLARSEPVKVGPMCALGAACRDDRELLDYVSLAFDGGGRVHYAFAVSKDLGNDATTALVHYAGPGV